MGLLIPVELKDKDKGRTLDGSGIALEATTPDLTTKTGADQEIAHHLDHAFPLKMIMRWICPPLSAKPQTTKNMKNIKRPADASNAESKATSFATVQIKRRMLVQLALFKLKMTTNWLSQKPLLHLRPSLCE